MARKTNIEDLVVHTDPLSFTGELKILAGNNVQTYNQDIQEYVPDRALVPTVLFPEVYVQDPNNVMTGNAELTGVEWYEGAPKANGSNRIVGNTDYEISEATVEGFPKYALRIKKNVPTDKPMEIYAVFTFTDKRTMTEVRVERSLSFYTATYDSKNYSVKLGCPDVIVVNPLDVVPDEQGNWSQVLTAQLYSGKNPVPDEQAAYWWQIRGIEGWRDLTTEELETLIVAGWDGQIWSKTIKVDARMIEDKLSLRVRAAHYTDSRPGAPQSDALQEQAIVMVELPDNITFSVVQTKGARVEYDMKTQVAYRLDISAGNKPISEKQYSFFEITWFGKSDKAGSQPVEIGKGRTVSFAPISKGAHVSFGYHVYAEVKQYSHYNTLVDGDNTVTDDEGNYIILPAYV